MPRPARAWMQSPTATLAVIALAMTCAPAAAPLGIPVAPTLEQVTAPVTDAVAATNLPVVPEATAAVADTVTRVAETADGVLAAGSGAGAGSGSGTTASGSTGGGTSAAPTTSAPSKTSSARRADPGPSATPAAGSTAPERTAAATAPAPTTDRVARGSAGATTPEPGEPPVAAASPAGAAADPAVERRSVDIITRIIEVVPMWAKTLIGALGALLVVLAIAAHLRLRRRAAEHLHQSLHDALTGLPNRTLFHELVTEALGATARTRGGVGVLLIDLDGFKEVNDTLGHRNGDRLLVQVADRLRDAVRTTDVVARLGGDEFAVLIPSLRDEDSALSVANALRAALQDTFAIDGLVVHTEASVGIAVGPRQGDDADTLIQHADVAMYVAKRERGRASLYDPARDHHSPERLTLVGDLRRAIEQDELALYYQPQIEPRTGRIGGVEALVRWHHPDRGLIPPDEFIPLAERTGLIQPLTCWVLEAAVRQCATWRAEGLDLWVAANLSAANLVEAGTADTLEELLRRWRIPAGAFRLEITETTAMADPERTHAVLAQLDALGVELAIDDFGTGYSSLSYLRRLPVHELKIDRSFVGRMATDPNDGVIVTATIEMGHSLGLRIVAEGVEDEETLRELTLHGCDLAQGYLFSRPLPPDELASWVVARRTRPTAVATHVAA